MPAEDDDSMAVPIVCPDCDTETSVPLADLPETLEQHNADRHDGESVATVDPELAEEIQRLAAEDLLDAE